jgi:Spy/CpxP family protein refolding chaperone
MTMKRLVSFIVTTALILSAVSVFAEPAMGGTGGVFADEDAATGNPGGGEGVPSTAKREEVRKKIEAVRIWRLTEELKLDEKTSGQLASFLSSLEEKRRELWKANRDATQNLRAALRTDEPDNRRLKAELDRIEKNQQEMTKLREKEINGIKNFLTIEQQARYLIFQQEFRREMRGMIAGARGSGPGQGMRGGKGPRIGGEPGPADR